MVSKASKALNRKQEINCENILTLIFPEYMILGCCFFSSLLCIDSSYYAVFATCSRSNSDREKKTFTERSFTETVREQFGHRPAGFFF